MKREKTDGNGIKHNITVLLLVLGLIFVTSCSEKRVIDYLKNSERSDRLEIICKCPEVEVPVCEPPSALTSETYVIEECNLTCYRPRCIINEALIFEKVKNFNYENKSPVSATWMNGEIAELRGSEIEAKFLVVRGAGEWNMHYCPVSLKVNASVVDIKTYNWCLIEYTGESVSKVSKDKVVAAILQRLGFRLTYDDSGWRPVYSQRDAYNSKHAEILNSSTFVSKPIKVIDVKYETGQSGLGCNIYETHLFLDVNLNIITGDYAYEECVD